MLLCSMLNLSFFDGSLAPRWPTVAELLASFDGPSPR